MGMRLFEKLYEAFHGKNSTFNLGAFKMHSVVLCNPAHSQTDRQTISTLTVSFSGGNNARCIINIYGQERQEASVYTIEHHMLTAATALCNSIIPCTTIESITGAVYSLPLLSRGAACKHQYIKLNTECNAIQ